MICVVFAVKEASVRTKVQKAQHESQERCPTNVIYSENLLHDKLSRTAGACNLGAISGIPAHIKQEFFFFLYIILLYHSLELHTFAQNTKKRKRETFQSSASSKFSQVGFAAHGVSIFHIFLGFNGTDRRSYFSVRFKSWIDVIRKKKTKESCSESLYSPEMLFLGEGVHLPLCEGCEGRQVHCCP